MANLKLIKDKVAAADAKQNTGGLLTRKVDTAVKVMMTRKVNPNQNWQVVLLVDRSGSMGNEYRNGAVQDAVDKALGFAVIVDDDGSVPTVFFDSRLETKTVGLDNFHDFVNKNRIDARGSTDLTAALIEAATITGNSDLFGGGGLFSRGGSKPAIKKMDTPVFLIVVTDGRPDDTRSATDAIRRLSYRGVFIKFIFVGTNRDGWSYLESLDDDIPVGVPFDRGGRLIDNVDAKKFASLGATSDDAFYDAMLDEVSTYLAAARQNQLI